jgi:hypothetical protein
MSSQTALDALHQFLDKASYKTDGDSYEQQLGGLLSDRFQNCERYWKFFVVPLTERMTGYPTSIVKNIRIRKGMNSELEDLAATHYSMFLNLIYAHIHLQLLTLSSLEDFYIHLASACDLVDTFLEKNYFLLLKCRGGTTRMLQTLARDEFLQMAAKWYDENYLTVYNQYLSKGKFAPLKLPSRSLLIKEFVGDYLTQKGLWKDYYQHSQAIREFRNAIVHDVQIGKLVIDGRAYIPKPTVIQSYRTWRQVFSVNSEEAFHRDFAYLPLQLNEDINRLESILNNLWEVLLRELEVEFFQEGKTALRPLYQVQI